MALTTALFLVGSTTEKVACEALHHPEESEIFQVLDKKFIQPFIRKQLPKSSSLHQDEIALQRFISNVSVTYGIVLEILGGCDMISLS